MTQINPDLITFKPLNKRYFPLLLKWLETPHVKAWWDSDVHWTPELIEQKYASYLQGFKVENGAAKPIHAFIICSENKPIGYIQYYNAYDFRRSAPLEGLPESLAAFDMLIGEPDYLGQGIGAFALKRFLEQFVDPSYTFTFADPDVRNTPAIRAYENAGFKKLSKHHHEVWMLRQNKHI